MSDVQVIGMEAILKKLKVLPERIQKNVLAGAIRASAKVIADEAKRNVPIKYGGLRDSIGVKKASKPRVTKKTLLIYKVSPMTKNVTRRFKLADGTKWSIKGEVDGWYGHFVEFGTYAKLDHPLVKPRTGRLGKKRAKMVSQGYGVAAHPFMRPAYEKKGAESIRVVKSYMTKRIDKEIAKL